MTGRRVTVLVPVYDEADTVEAVIDGIVSALGGESDLDVEVHVLDDGSTDWSDALEARLRARDRVRVSRFRPNRGKGATLDRVLPDLSEGIVAVIDGDGEYAPGDLPAVLAPLLADEADWVSGARYGFDRPRPRQYLATWCVNRIVNAWFRRLSGVRFRDLLSGLYAFRADKVAGIRLREARFAYTPELLWKLIRLRGARVAEVPVSYRFRTYAEGKKIRWWETATILWAIFRYRTVR